MSEPAYREAFASRARRLLRNRRGWFRVWVVASVLWVVGSGAIILPALPHRLAENGYTPVASLCPAENPWAEWGAEHFGRRGDAKRPLPVPCTINVPRAATPDERRAIFILFGAMILVPPLALLFAVSATGCLLKRLLLPVGRWVARGFSNAPVEPAGAAASILPPPGPRRPRSTGGNFAAALAVLAATTVVSKCAASKTHHALQTALHGQEASPRR